MNGDRLERRRIEIELLVERDVAGDRGGLRGKQSVTIGIGRVDCLCSDVSTAAAAILDDEWLAKTCLQLGSKNPRDRVDAAPCRGAHNDLHRATGIVRGAVLLRACRYECHNGNAQNYECERS